MGKIWKIIRDYWYRFPAGVSIAMMGLLAAAYPIFAPDPIPPREKAVWVACFFALMCLEIVVIFKERGRQDQSFLAQIAKLDEIRSAYDAHSVALERLRRSVKSGSLRDRALRLSESLLEFVHDRLENQPTMLGTWLNRTKSRAAGVLGSGNDVLRYHQETLSIYLERFSWNVLGVIEDFENHEIVDENLRNAANSPANTGDIFFIGQRIGELAEDIKD
jgi:hypothetical protein